MGPYLSSESPDSALVRRAVICCLGGYRCGCEHPLTPTYTHLHPLGPVHLRVALGPVSPQIGRSAWQVQEIDWSKMQEGRIDLTMPFELDTTPCCDSSCLGVLKMARIPDKLCDA